MTARATLAGKLRQATFAWTVALSLLVVWAVSQPRPADLPGHSAAAGLAEARGADHVAASAAAAGKADRPSELRSGTGPDLLALVPAMLALPEGAEADDAACPPAALHCLQPRQRPEPRAPPLT